MCEPKKLLAEICFKSSDPRPAASCSHRITGYFLAPSYPVGTNKRYCIVSPVALRYDRAKNPSPGDSIDCAFETAGVRSKEIVAMARLDRTNIPHITFPRRIAHRKNNG